VFGFTDRNLFLLAVVLYGLATLYAVLLWRRGFREDNRVIYILLFAGAGLHTLAMIKRGFSFERCPVTNLYEATTFVAWTVAATYLVIGLFRRFRFIGAFASPLLFALGVFALMPELDKHGPEPQFRPPASSLHASMILLAYGAFGLASVAGLMFLAQERDLKFRKVRAVLAFLPSLQRLEVVTWRLLLAGFGLLTIGLVLGAGWLKQEKGVYFKPDAKIVWSLFVWLMYLTLLLARTRFGQHGRRFAWGTIGTFAFVMLTFWGFNLLSDIHHPQQGAPQTHQRPVGEGGLARLRPTDSAPRPLESSNDGREAGVGDEPARLDLIAADLPMRGF
jgi:HemX protein